MVMSKIILSSFYGHVSSLDFKIFKFYNLKNKFETPLGLIKSIPICKSVR